MRLSRTQLWATVSVCLTILLVPSLSRAQLVYPEVIVDMQRLPEEAQVKLVGLDSILVAYLETQPWAGDDYQYDFPIQINIYFTEYHPDPAEDRYKAKMIATNKQDVRLEDVRWEFGLRLPLRFQPGAFHPFASVVDFYVWVLIGMEYDRLEKLGGDSYYDKARQLFLQSSGSIYYFGWDRRMEMLREITDPSNQTKRELDFFYFTGIYFDQRQDYKNSKDYLFYSLKKLDQVTVDIQQRFLDANHRQLAEALMRAGYPKGIQVLIQLDPQHRSVYESIGQPSEGE
ncbi:MAG: DUF4835 family protein [bacterium]|nr:DUF4835 family protein [bacterium]